MDIVKAFLTGIGFVIGFTVTIAIDLVKASVILAFYAVLANPFITYVIWYLLNIVFQGNGVIASQSLGWWAVAQPVFHVTFILLWIITTGKAILDD